MRLRVIHIGETDSTNSYCRQLAGGADIAVWADHQTAGRGCGTNSWESAAGRNVLFSVLCHPTAVRAADQFILSMANAVALRDTLADYVADVTIKWPNDIYWRDRKLCGTLIETTLQGPLVKDCIIGTGINVNQERFVSDAPNPVSLRQILGHEVECQEVLQRVLRHIEKRLEAVADGDWEAIRAHYRHHLYRLEETHGYRFLDGSEEQCKLTGVTDDGHLLLLSEERGACRLAFKEVQFII